MRDTEYEHIVQVLYERLIGKKKMVAESYNKSGKKITF